MSNAPASPSADATASVLELKQSLEALPSSLRLSDASADALYSLAYHQAEQGRLTTALQYFSLLMLYRPTNNRYLQGLAHTYQLMERYDEALSIYSFLASVSTDPVAHSLAIAECLLLRGDVEEAKYTVELVLRHCEKDDSDAEAHGDLMGRATALSDLLRIAIEKAGANA